MDEKRTIWCGNLSDHVTEELLYELFLQAAPLEKVKIPTDREGRRSNFAFITFKHEVSVNYVQQLLNGTLLFDKAINIKPRNTNSLGNPLDRNSRNEFQNSLPQYLNHDLLRTGQMQYNYELVSNNYNDNRLGRWERNTYSEREDRYRDNHHPKSYKSHENRQNGSSLRRNNYSDRKNYNGREIVAPLVALIEGWDGRAFGQFWCPWERFVRLD
ncbi:hypothetical protein NQ317_017077 [Molorchus minor]|uniref:RRM domain-containing protein n=1 Tax=Molorchus minor TaxID=1323400 RepID=A0ABQ9K7E9_9CUCU|nr:hypothetical protein NQ317_017077 [Molorchus minor]